MDSVKNKKPFVNCELCGQKVLRTQLKGHSAECRNNKNGRGIFKCPAPECKNKRFKTKGMRKKHIKRVHDIPIKCPYANCHSIIKKVSWSHHVKMVHEKLKEECTNCGKKISYKNLNAHFQLCTSDGSLLFKCDKEGCDRAFKTSGARSTHVWRVHSEPMKCPIPNCEAVMKNANLLLHVKQVHEKQKQECQNCGKKFSYGNLNQHLKLCTSDGSRPFECVKEGCDKSFKTSKDKSTHISIVHSAPVKCPIKNCGAMVKKGYLLKHMTRLHEGMAKEHANHGNKVS